MRRPTLASCMRTVWACRRTLYSLLHVAKLWRAAQGAEDARSARDKLVSCTLRRLAQIAEAERIRRGSGSRRSSETVTVNRMIRIAITQPPSRRFRPNAPLGSGGYENATNERDGRDDD